MTAEPAAAPLPRVPAPRVAPPPGLASAPPRVTKFLVPDVIFGVGVLAQVGQVVRRHGGVRVFVVGDPWVAVRALVGEAGLPASLREIGVRGPQIDGIARNTLDDAYIVTNPRPVSEEDARAICLAAW